MAVITVTGEPGCRTEEVARQIAARLGFAFVSEGALRRMVAEEYGSETALPDRLYPAGVTVILARLACRHHLVVCAPGAETLVLGFPGVLRVALTAADNYQTGTLMLDHRMDRAAARGLLRQLQAEQGALRRRQFGAGQARPREFDLTVNAESASGEMAAALVESAARLRALADQGLMLEVQQAEVEFRACLKLARHSITPAGRAAIAPRQFANASEQIFANLLDFYRIGWDYEPRAFPIQWDSAGRVLESFTPDFHLPELDLYVELTTMKQANVTRKNRKVKLLKTIYPHVNIQVFYQKDFHNLIFKYGLAGNRMLAPAAIP